MCHESHTLAVPELKWLGILPSDIDRQIFCDDNKLELHYITLSLFHTPVTSGASTKLCTTVSICQCKQMSFQLPFESTRIIKLLESKRKIIPSFQSGIREASLAELALLREFLEDNKSRVFRWYPSKVTPTTISSP